MSSPESAATPSAPPKLDAETQALAQELFDLIRAGQETERLASLLQRGLVPNLRDGKGDSLLMLASYHGHQAMTRLLLEHGADPALANDRGQIPLAGAAFKGDTAMARLLLEHDARPDECGPDGKTPLMFAAMFNRVEIIDLLLERGANPTCASAENMTALNLAKAMGAHDAAARLANATGKE